MPRSTRRSSWSSGAGAAHAAGLVNAVLRRAAASGRRWSRHCSATTRPPRPRRSPTPRRSGWRGCGGEELGAEGARSLLAACNEPAEVGDAGQPPARRAPALLCKLREAGVEARAAAGDLAARPRRRSSSSRDAPARLSPSLVEAGELTPQSRGSAAVVEVLDPSRGEHVLDLCAGPGIKTGQIAARMGDRGEVISVELDSVSGRRRSPRRRARLGLRSVTVIEADAGELELALGLRPHPARRALLGPRRARLAPRRPLAQVAARRSSGWSRCSSGHCCGAARLLRPGGVLVYATCTISRRENEDQVAALLNAALAGRAAGA